jgi:hypothetical protein
MKIELEDSDIQRIVERLAAVLRPDFVKAKVVQIEPLMDTQGVARYLGVDISWVNKAVSEKRIPHNQWYEPQGRALDPSEESYPAAELRGILSIKVGKYNKFKKSTIDDWIGQNTVKPISDSSLADYRSRRNDGQGA